MTGTEAGALRAELIQRFRGADSPLEDDAFNRLALRVFERNVATVPAYAAYCRTRDRVPGAVEHWRDIPAVPTAAFRELALRSSDRRTERVFRTSGTTRGRERRGEHHVADLDLYRASLRSTFRRFLLPDGARLPFLSLVPPAAAMPDSSLAFMISDVVEVFGAPGSAVFADMEGIDFHALGRAVERGSREGPVLLLGTSASFIHWVDRLAAEGRTLELPAGSRLMDTGGYKGAGREVEPAALRALYRERLGLPDWACVNEYGMTELLSQRYDPTLRARLAESGSRAWYAAGEEAGADAPRRKLGPPWLRSLAVDPETLDPLPGGERGILRHVDLANLDSVAAVQTEDAGRVDGDGLVLEGRLPGAPPRGCSLAMDLLLEGRP
ncbi:MAG: long-chain fatty acid--CoA ligase [Gemmatimonadota bacterium]